MPCNKIHEGDNFYRDPHTFLFSSSSSSYIAHCNQGKKMEKEMKLERKKERETKKENEEKKWDIVVQHFLILTTDLYAILDFLPPSLHGLVFFKSFRQSHFSS